MNPAKALIGRPQRLTKKSEFKLKKGFQMSLTQIQFVKTFIQVEHFRFSLNYAQEPKLY